MKKHILLQSFYNRPAEIVAKELLGKYLVCEYRGEKILGMITETEAYVGPHDLASHASKGHTQRNAPMFGSPARWYLYLVYGMHWMLNAVTGEKGYPAAVLIRGCVAVNSKSETLSSKQSQNSKNKNFNLSGPGRLTKYFHINGRFNGKNISGLTGLWIENRGVVVPMKNIIRVPRIGVDYAGPKWSKEPYRFIFDLDKFKH